MSHFALRRHGLSLQTAAAAVVCALALAGCGAGQITQTSTQVSAVDGAAATVGQVGLRNVSIIFGSGKNVAVYSAGGSAPLQMSIVNFGGADDRLVSVTSPVAGSVTVTGDPRIAGGRTLRISGGAGATGGGTAEGGSTASGGPSATTTPTRSAAPTPSAGSTASATPTSSAAPTTEATPTPSADGTTSASIVLTGLKQDIRAGLTYPVEFTFANAGKVTVQVPVANPSSPRSAAAG